MPNKPINALGLFILSAFAYPVVHLLTKALPFLPTELPVYAVAAIAFASTVTKDRKKGLAERLWRRRTVPLTLGSLLGLGLVLTPLWAKMWYSGYTNDDLVVVLMTAAKNVAWVMGASVAAIVLSYVRVQTSGLTLPAGFVFTLVYACVTLAVCMMVVLFRSAWGWTESACGLVLALTAAVVMATECVSISDEAIGAAPCRFALSQICNTTMELGLVVFMSFVFANAHILGVEHQLNALHMSTWIIGGSLVTIAMRVKGVLERASD